MLWALWAFLSLVHQRFSAWLHISITRGVLKNLSAQVSVTTNQASGLSNSHEQPRQRTSATYSPASYINSTVRRLCFEAFWWLAAEPSNMSTSSGSTLQGKVEKSVPAGVYLLFSHIQGRFTFELGSKWVWTHRLDPGKSGGR